MNSKKTTLLAIFIAVFISQTLAQVPILVHSEFEKNGLTSIDRSAVPMKWPYPVLFVHGFTGNGDTWQAARDFFTQQAVSFGGYMRYNLNLDDNNGTCNIYDEGKEDVASFVGSGIYTFNPGDFYIINFQVNKNNQDSPGDISSQSAAVKQALAVRNSIADIMAITGKDKVILFGHSMGGLAIRKYVQDQDFWQADGKHHVAKLITMGTPNGGSNISLTPASVFTEYNEYSEAVRDLRTSYFWNGKDGVFLYGGPEDLYYMYDSQIGDFVNADVNCDGFNTFIEYGLNEYSFPDDIELAYSISSGILDLVVSDEKERLSNYVGRPMEGFSNTAYSGFAHINMPKNTAEVSVLLDDPDDFTGAYKIDFNKTYYGTFTAQGEGAPYPSIDYDDYVFKVTTGGYYTAKGLLLPTNKSVNMKVLNSSFQDLFEVESNGASTVQKGIYLTPGTYYLEFAAVPDDEDYLSPHRFSVTTTTDANEPIEPLFEAIIGPNPAIDKFSINAIFENAETGNVSLIDLTGRVIETFTFENINEFTKYMDVSSLPTGTYIVFLECAAGTKTFKLVKQ